MLRGMLEVLRNPRLKPILALNFCNCACTFTVQGRGVARSCARCIG